MLLKGSFVGTVISNMLVKFLTEYKKRDILTNIDEGIYFYACCTISLIKTKKLRNVNGTSKREMVHDVLSQPPYQGI